MSKDYLNRLAEQVERRECVSSAFINVLETGITARTTWRRTPNKSMKDYINIVKEFTECDVKVISQDTRDGGKEFSLLLKIVPRSIIWE